MKDFEFCEDKEAISNRRIYKQGVLKHNLGVILLLCGLCLPYTRTWFVFDLLQNNSISVGAIGVSLMFFAYSDFIKPLPADEQIFLNPKTPFKELFLTIVSFLCSTIGLCAFG